MPATPVLLGRCNAAGLREALCAEPLAPIGARKRPARIEACWPADEGVGAQRLEIADLRDWHHNVHRGMQRYATGFLEMTQ